MIHDHLETYLKEFGSDANLRIIRSIVIDGHEVAWTELSGVNANQEPYAMRSTYCECDFTEGVGWARRPRNGREKLVKLDYPHCLPRQAALYLRRLELRQKYQTHLAALYPGDYLKQLFNDFPSLVNWLIEESKAGEWIEDGNGARFWGGYFYSQALTEIFGLTPTEVREGIDAMVAAKKISLEGMVVLKYYRPTRASWSKAFQIELDGFLGIAKLPTHGNMLQVWKYEVRNPDGKRATVPDTTDNLLHESVFGPDAEDVEVATHRLEQLIAEARELLTTSP